MDDDDRLHEPPIADPAAAEAAAWLRNPTAGFRGLVDAKRHLRLALTSVRRLEGHPERTWAGRARAAADQARRVGLHWPADILTEAAGLIDGHRAQMALVEEERDHLAAEVERNTVELGHLRAALRAAEENADRNAGAAVDATRGAELDVVTVVAYGTHPVLAEVAEERARQDARWGEQNHPDVAPTITEAIVGMDIPHRAYHVARAYFLPTADEAKARCDQRGNVGELSWGDIAVEELAEALEAAVVGSPTDVRDEVVQLAAVAVAWVQAIDRRLAETTDPEENTTP